MFFKKNKNKSFKIEQENYFTLQNYIFYLEYYAQIYDTLVKEGLLPEEDKEFRKAIIQSFRQEQIVDLLCPQKQSGTA